MRKIPKIKELSYAERIVLLNVLFFIVSHLFVHIGDVSLYAINHWFGLPQNVDDFFTKPWTIITYSFFHANFQHLFWNMLFLFFMGHIFFNLFSKKQFLKIYLLGIFFSGVTFLLIRFLFPLFFDNSILLGASGAIMTLLLFVCSARPDYDIYILFSIRVKLWVVALLLIMFDIFQISENPGGKIVHLGGAFAGYIFGSFVERTHKIKIKNKDNLTKINTSTEILKSSASTEKLTEEQKIKQHKVNIILDKISTSGYTSLSDEEKKFLFDFSKDMNH